VPVETTWDAEQLSAVAVAPEIRQIVLAGPGSGKTQVVLGLVARLDEEHDVSPSDGVLVVSFSRAAVAAVRSRASDGSSPPVGVRTLDSLASRLLDSLDTSEEWRRTSFDSRIRRATELLADSGWDELDTLEHLVVDEVQDVVDVRADFLLAILRSLPDDAGFTLLGDPQQALYDFQLDRSRKSAAGSLLETVRAEFSPVAQVELRGQYRAESEETRRIMGAGRGLGAMPSRARLAAVEDMVTDLVGLGALEELAGPLTQWTGSTAVLCRTNGEALEALRRLRSAGIRPTIMRGAAEVGCHRWVADVLTGAPREVVSRSWFIKQAEGVVEDPSTSWLRLRRLTRDRGADLSVRGVARRLVTAAPPVDLQTRPAGDCLISTVHRAKGLEFDNVVLVGADRWLLAVDETEAEEEARVAFVALTRPRSRVVKTDGVHDWAVRKDERSGRWIRSGRKKWQTFGLEVLPTDLRGETADDAIETQKYLVTQVEVGDGVDLQLDRARSTLERPSYVVTHGTTPVGRTNDDFGVALAKRLGLFPGREIAWPGLSGGVVEGVETTPGDRPGATHGLALGLRLNGLLEVNW